jgi:tRNA-dihydrouridine synthase
MIGRATIGNPWIFKEIKAYLAGNIKPFMVDIDERVNVCKEHIERSLVWKGEVRGINEMRKHYSNYFRGFPHFKEFKMKLMLCKNSECLFEILEELRSFYHQ